MKNERKEELKDEMKNRISMALKDPILQQGFEIICKENAELKIRNAELKGMYAHSAREAGTYKQFLELKEKENAELKADNDARKFAMAMSEKVEKQLREENGKLKDEWQEQVQKANDEAYARTLQTMQLTKAKELIENIIRVTWGEGWNYSLDWKVKAEAFLNSEVEK